MHLKLKREIQKTAEATGDLTGNKFANKITKVSKYSPKNTSRKVEKETEIPKGRNTKNDWGSKINIII